MAEPWQGNVAKHLHFLERHLNYDKLLYRAVK